MFENTEKQSYTAGHKWRRDSGYSLICSLTRAPTHLLPTHSPSHHVSLHNCTSQLHTGLQLMGHNLRAPPCAVPQPPHSPTHPVTPPSGVPPSDRTPRMPT